MPLDSWSAFCQNTRNPWAPGGAPSDEPYFRYGGWHVDYFLAPQAIQVKLAGFSHAEFDRAPFNTIDWIKGAFVRGYDIVNRTGPDALAWFDCRAGNANVPTAVRLNPVWFAHWCPLASRPKGSALWQVGSANGIRERPTPPPSQPSKIQSQWPLVSRLFANSQLKRKSKVTGG